MYGERNICSLDFIEDYYLYVSVFGLRIFNIADSIDLIHSWCSHVLDDVEHIKCIGLC